MTCSDMPWMAGFLNCEQYVSMRSFLPVLVDPHYYLPPALCGFTVSSYSIATCRLQHSFLTQRRPTSHLAEEWPVAEWARFAAFRYDVNSSLVGRSPSRVSVGSSAPQPANDPAQPAHAVFGAAQPRHVCRAGRDKCSNSCSTNATRTESKQKLKAAFASAMLRHEARRLHDGTENASGISSIVQLSTIYGSTALLGNTMHFTNFKLT